MICDGQLAGARGVDSFHLSRQLARLGEEFPSIKDDILQRYERMNACPAKSILKSALVELADPSDHPRADPWICRGQAAL